MINRGWTQDCRCTGTGKNMEMGFGLSVMQKSVKKAMCCNLLNLCSIHPLITRQSQLTHQEVVVAQEAELAEA